MALTQGQAMKIYAGHVSQGDAQEDAQYRLFLMPEALCCLTVFDIDGFRAQRRPGSKEVDQPTSANGWNRIM